MRRIQQPRVHERRGEQRRILGRKLRGGLVEIRARGRVGAVNAVSPLDHVQIQLEDALLRELRLERAARS